MTIVQKVSPWHLYSKFFLLFFLQRFTKNTAKLYFFPYIYLFHYLRSFLECMMIKSDTLSNYLQAKGRVECYCINPDNGIITKVIALNQRVSTEKLLIAAGLGSGAMVTTLGMAALLFTLTKGFRSSNKTGRTQNSRKSRKISVQSLKDEEN